MVKTLLAVGIGGFAGSICRFLISQPLARFNAHDIPYGTLIANILGSFLLGFFIIYVNKFEGDSSIWRALLITGFCGGFTTFSTFTYENIKYLQNANYLSFSMYTLLSITIALIMLILGSKIGRAYF